MKKKIQLVFFIFFISYQLKASPKNNYFTEEVSKLEISSVFIIDKDSIFRKKYNHLLKKYKEEKYVEALNEAFDLYEIVKNNNKIEDQFLIKILIADIYDKTNNFTRSLSNYKEALKLIRSFDLDKKQIQFSRDQNLAKIYLRIGSAYQKKSKRDSAIFYFKKLEDLSDLNDEVLNYKAASFGSLAGLYQLDSLFDKAILYANKSIKINKETNNKISEAIVTTNLGSIYLSLEKFEQAKETYLRAIELVKNNNSQNSVRLKADLYYNLAWAMRNLQEYEAYDYQELSYEIEDGIRDKEIRTMIEKVAGEYNVETARKIEENKRLKDRTTFWIYAIGSFIIILSLLYWLNFYKLRQKNLALKLSQTQLIQNQNIEKLKSELQTRILNATIDGKESERKEIAETLHDSVSALLSSANLHLMATKTQFNGKAPIEIDKTQKIITEASQKIRDLSHTLVSSVLLKFGLNFAVKDMASKYSNSTLNIETDIENIRRYHQNFEIKVYNIIQELVNNVLKHSKANNAIIKLLEIDNKICFQISDDGLGFDKIKISNKDGLGINQIDARIQVMKGTFSIQSSIGNGAVIKVELPIVEKDTTIHV